MSIPWIGMIRAEIVAVFRRPIGMAAVGIGVAIGASAVLLMSVAQRMASGEGAMINNVPLAQIVQFSGPNTAIWALNMRNFWVLPLVLLLCTGASFATEINDHTMRERLVRPVPRWSVVVVKIAALMLLSLGTLVGTALLAFVGGSLAFGFDGPWLNTLAGYAASWLTDLGIIAIGLLLSTLLRSAGTVVVGGILFLLVDWAARAALSLLGFLGVEGVDGIARFFPGSALACWQGMSEGWQAEPFAGLVVLIGACVAATLFRFSKMDIP